MKLAADITAYLEQAVTRQLTEEEQLFAERMADWSDWMLTILDREKSK